jgi:hypothetical protein
MRFCVALPLALFLDHVEQIISLTINQYAFGEDSREIGSFALIILIGYYYERHVIRDSVQQEVRVR